MIGWAVEFDLGELPKPAKNGRAREWDAFWEEAIERAQHKDEPLLEVLRRCRLAYWGFYQAEWYDRLDTLWEAGLRTVLIPCSGLRLLPEFCQRAGFTVTAVDLSRTAMGFAQAHPAAPWEWDLFCAAEPLDEAKTKEQKRVISDLSRKRRERATRAGGSLDYRLADILSLHFDPGALDIVILQNVLHVFGKRERRDLLDRIHGWLRPGGVVVIDSHGMAVPDEVLSWAVSEELESLGFSIRPRFDHREFEPYDDRKMSQAEADAQWLARYRRYRADVVARVKAGEKLVFYQYRGHPVPLWEP